VPDETSCISAGQYGTDRLSGDLGASGRLEAVVVDHDAGDVLASCVTSLHAAGASLVVVVDNAVPSGSSKRVLTREPEAGGTGPTITGRTITGPTTSGPTTRVLEVDVNLGYGSGANRGAAGCDAELILICNADVVVERDSLAHLAEALDKDLGLAIVGPRVLEPDGTRYPSARRFPSLIEGAGHAIAGRIWPHNRFSRKYRMTDIESAGIESGDIDSAGYQAGDIESGDMDPGGPTGVDWVSGSCMLVRRDAFEELGGFDEAYFMYGEDVDLCWRAHRAGYGVAYVPAASVTHVGGISTRRAPYRMLAAHHRSALRFATRSLSGPRRLALPAVAVALGLRFVAEVARQASSGRSPQV
jgi:N-acetylglucosaminyl-diphospho-decaprenol L-rhamnosyltransferase